ncbi:MAG: hypothetical protein ACRDSL_19045 [Pseudonocardiaceae bacterium]
MWIIVWMYLLDALALRTSQAWTALDAPMHGFSSETSSSARLALALVYGGEARLVGSILEYMDADSEWTPPQLRSRARQISRSSD